LTLHIRSKLLILLLFLAILPLAVVSFVDHQAMRRVGTKLGDDIHDLLRDSATEQLQRAIRDHAASVDRQARLSSTIVKQQAQLVEQFLSRDDLAQTYPLFFDHQFDELDPSIPGLQQSAAHGRVGADGEVEPRWISREVASFRIAQNVSPDDVHDDLMRLSQLQRSYRDVHEMLPETILWQYTSLESGIHASFPGKGGYPAEYEPRARRWYTQAREEGRLVWVASMVDVTTGQSIVTGAMPVYMADGTFAGVTALDVRIDRILTNQKLPTEWGDQAEMFMVSLLDPQWLRAQGVHTTSEQRVPMVIAHNSSIPPDRDWRDGEFQHALFADQMPGLDMLGAAAVYMASGVERAPHHDVDSLWAFGPVESGARTGAPLYLLIIVPYDDIVARATAVRADVEQRTWRMIRVTGIIAVVVVIVVVLAALLGSYDLTLPVRRLADVAGRVAEGDFDARVTLNRWRDELSQLADAFNSMIPKLRDRVRIRESLQVAMEVQQSLLPEGPPDIPGLDIAGTSIYCDETGGDYYDFIEFEEINPHRVGIAVGDVVGHGVAAALLMATCRALLRSSVGRDVTLKTVFTEVNQQLCQTKFTGKFMTLYYIILDTRQKSMQWLSAGHDPAILFDPQIGDFVELAGADVPIGVQRDWSFSQFARTGWKAGQVMLLGTDGIWECRNVAGEMYGKERLRDLVKSHAHMTAHAICCAVQDAVEAWRGDIDQQDDITLVVVKMLQ
jgi:sigma-B regulation protein RsbU (phosphoserine phosphatase)